ncbi:hypothetical protein GBO17_04585 [Mycobacterium avium subsp. hominissuis]|uniref:hypothetical protein n=1 Tax=Mycobacterium avium TaxID=1764 RepID=UPI001CC4463A|nr:hypothetical protein [Mycobacterium avium]MBZ4557303.1 hypothetical protein [Mycobacterium avium subsp. hominissuis]MBZ4567766.1 hypothetical protein [Mycobacterium avium subsp. hominissuis]MBZ4586537.1 hypothetical protein [Mycobacterium avium subsp. hominissuis]MBZ4624516.1 hypothetical protein [Mycobacterium avium subsp. hominissuis]
MASPGRARIDITDDLAFVGEQIEALERLGGREDVDDERVYDLSIRWGVALAGRLPRMAHYSALGQLVEQDERRFQALCDRLRELSPLIDRFGLARPRLPGAADASANGRRRRGRWSKTPSRTA